MKHQTRRQFLKTTATATAAVASASFVGESAATGASRSFSIVVDPEDDVARQPPAQWAVEELRQALQSRGITAQVLASTDQLPPQSDCIVVASHRTAMARQILNSTTLPDIPESSTLKRGKTGTREVLLASGSDVRGIVYAVLELADRVPYAADAAAA